MAITHAPDGALDYDAQRTSFDQSERPYKDASASQLADTVEAHWDDEIVRNGVLGELLTRALATENALASQHR